MKKNITLKIGSILLLGVLVFNSLIVTTSAFEDRFANDPLGSGQNNNNGNDRGGSFADLFDNATLGSGNINGYDDPINNNPNNNDNNNGGGGLDLPDYDNNNNGNDRGGSFADLFNNATLGSGNINGYDNPTDNAGNNGNVNVEENNGTINNYYEENNNYYNYYYDYDVEYNGDYSYSDNNNYRDDYTNYDDYNVYYDRYEPVYYYDYYGYELYSDDYYISSAIDSCSAYVKDIDHYGNKVKFTIQNPITKKTIAVFTVEL